MTVRWVFEDPVTLLSETFIINPSEGGTPSFEKNEVYANTAAPQGNVLIMEGRDNYQQLSFSGVILYKEQYDMFLAWWQKRYQIKMTDDLGRSFIIYIKSFKPTRKRSYQYPWKHDYVIDYTVLEQLV
jgi:hypothetical protein